MISIFVGNLSYQTTEHELSSLFGRYGRVSSVRMMSDRSTGTPRGFAFVSMPSFEDAEEAIIHLNGASLGGRSLTVNEARSKDSVGGPAMPGRRSALLDSL
ncbi:MAG: RNA-binding protein [Planctomyces sp.]|nr:RNA-binding protein [Planctomyces sp.]